MSRRKPSKQARIAQRSNIVVSLFRKYCLTSKSPPPQLHERTSSFSGQRLDAHLYNVGILPIVPDTRKTEGNLTSGRITSIGARKRSVVLIDKYRASVVGLGRVGSCLRGPVVEHQDSCSNTSSGLERRACSLKCGLPVSEWSLTQLSASALVSIFCHRTISGNGLAQQCKVTRCKDSLGIGLIGFCKNRGYLWSVAYFCCW